jgi:hypothetical protein
MNSHGLSTWTVIVRSLQRPSPKFKGRMSSPFQSCPKLPLQSNGQDLVNFCFFFHEKNRRPLDYSLGFHLCNPNFLQESIALVQKYCHVGILDCDGLWTLAPSVKGREADFLVFCNMICGNQRPLYLRP